mgnify:CR=1 FL=1
MFGRFVRWLGHKMAGAAHRIDEKKRDELRSTPFPDAYHPHVSEVAQTAGLTAEQRAKLHGDILIPEDRIKAFRVKAALGEITMEDALDGLLGSKWDAELEPFRHAGDGAPVRWLHQVI